MLASLIILILITVVLFIIDESQKFRKAFDDPEFRKLFSQYMDDLQDPTHRAETETYISQLEKEDKVHIYLYINNSYLYL
jgi:hypothetical protein